MVLSARCKANDPLGEDVFVDEDDEDDEEDDEDGHGRYGHTDAPVPADAPPPPAAAAIRDDCVAGAAAEGAAAAATHRLFVLRRIIYTNIELSVSELMNVDLSRVECTTAGYICCERERVDDVMLTS